MLNVQNKNVSFKAPDPKGDIDLKVTQLPVTGKKTVTRTSETKNQIEHE